MPAPSSIVFASAFTGIKNGQSNMPDDSDAFTNRYPFDLLVDELRFSWTSGINYTQFALANPQGTLWGDVVRCRLKFGRVGLTDGFVPVSLLAPVRDWAFQAPEPLTAATELPSSWVWRFPKPLYLPAGQKLLIEMGNFNDWTLPASNFGFATLTARVSMQCRPSQGPAPSMIDLPYAAKFLGQIWGGGSVQPGQEPSTSEISTPTDLYNPFSVPMQVERFTLNTLASSPFTGLLTPIVDGLEQSVVAGGTDRFGMNWGLDRRYVTARMVTADGFPVIRDYVPVGSVFSANDRSWLVNVPLDANDYFILDLVEQMPVNDNGNYFLARVNMGMIGCWQAQLAAALSV